MSQAIIASVLSGINFLIYYVNITRLQIVTSVTAQIETYGKSYLQDLRSSTNQSNLYTPVNCETKY